MKAVITRGDGTVELADLPKPVIEQPEDVVLRVTASAVCGTDVHFSRMPILGPSTALGHEFLGEVIEVGADVQGFAVGDRVKSRMFVSCGHCTACLSGNQIWCPEYLLFGGLGPSGRQLSGGQAEFVRIPHADRTLTPIVEGLSDSAALLLTDTLPTAWEAVVGSGTPAGKTFAVVGAGPVGQQVIAVAYALGAAAVYAVDLDQRRLDAAERVGGIPVNGAEAPAARIKELTGRGVDVAVDAVGSQAAITTASECVAVGGVVALVGAMLMGNVTFAVANLSHKSVTVKSVMGNPYATEHRITPLLTGGRLMLDDIVDIEVPLDDAVDAYRRFAAREVNKIVLVP